MAEYTKPRDPANINNDPDVWEPMSSKKKGKKSNTGKPEPQQLNLIKYIKFYTSPIDAVLADIKANWKKRGLNYDIDERMRRQMTHNKRLSVKRKDESERVESYRDKMPPQNKRRQDMGIQATFFDSYEQTAMWPNFQDNISWYIRTSSSPLADRVLGAEILERRDVWKMLRRAKNYLARRKFSGDLNDFGVLDLRREWTKNLHGVNTLLDLFPGLKYSYSSFLPSTAIARRRKLKISDIDENYLDVFVSDSGLGSSLRARIDDVSRSHNIRLDPVDSVKELYRYRLRVQECLDWARCVDVVPVMMTLTVFHRWHSLKGLVSVLKKAWNYFFTGTRAATRRSAKMGLCGYIRRMEETINKGQGTNSGWHPHYHVILFVSRDKLDVLSNMEDELREAWCVAVERYFESEFGEAIPDSYRQSFHEHGLWLSRDFDSVRHGQVCAPLRVVKDSAYMAKIMGYDPRSVYGGDKEITSLTQKDSFIPFDLLLEDTAENNDLWVEYALSMKGEFNFYFSRSLTRAMNEYYTVHPDKKPLPRSLPASRVVARVHKDAYHFFYRTFGLDGFLKHAAQGFESLFIWCRDRYKEAELGEMMDRFDFLPMDVLPNTRFKIEKMLYQMSDAEKKVVWDEKRAEYNAEYVRERDRMEAELACEDQVAIEWTRKNNGAPLELIPQTLEELRLEFERENGGKKKKKGKRRQKRKRSDL